MSLNSENSLTSIKLEGAQMDNLVVIWYYMSKNKLQGSTVCLSKQNYFFKELFPFLPAGLP